MRYLLHCTHLTLAHYTTLSCNERKVPSRLQSTPPHCTTLAVRCTKHHYTVFYCTELDVQCRLQRTPPHCTTLAVRCTQHCYTASESSVWLSHMNSTPSCLSGGIMDDEAVLMVNKQIIILNTGPSE